MNTLATAVVNMQMSTPLWTVGNSKCEGAGSLQTRIKLHSHAAAVRLESVKRLLALQRSGKRYALVLEPVEKKLLGELADRKGGYNLSGDVVRGSGC